MLESAGMYLNVAVDDDVNDGDITIATDANNLIIQISSTQNTSTNANAIQPNDTISSVPTTLNRLDTATHSNTKTDLPSH